MSQTFGVCETPKVWIGGKSVGLRLVQLIMG
ncbi:MAG: hypothetical protein HW378_1779 [Anaerolineales bacterium]|nr:hypothetical protein [Anaerolineales bacterium]MBM2848559.1 hypothetical protein [Anaerolineales bacterium]